MKNKELTKQSRSAKAVIFGAAVVALLGLTGCQEKAQSAPDKEWDAYQKKMSTHKAEVDAKNKASCLKEFGKAKCQELGWKFD